MESVEVIQKSDNSTVLKNAADAVAPDMRSKILVKGDVLAEGNFEGQVIQKQVVYCPICGAFIKWGAQGLTDSRSILVCPNGHKVATKSYD